MGLAWLGLRRAGSLLGSAWDGVSEFAKSLFISKDTTNTIETLSNTKEYEIVMTDSGYARKYANGRYEYIDDVAAQAEMYKDTYGGEVIQTAYKGNTEFNPDRIQEVRELQEDGSWKVTVYDEEGKIAQQYYEVKKLDTSKALEYGSRQYIMTLNDLGQTDPNLVQILTLSLNQGENAGLQQELEKAIDKKMIKDIDAAIVRNTACVAATLWINLVLEGANIEEFGEYYAHWANEGKIRAKDAFMTYKDQQAIAFYYGYELQRITSYTEFEKFISNSNGVQFGQLQYYNGILESNHNVNLYKYNGGWYVSDVGRMANHGIHYRKVLDKDKNFRYFQYFTKSK